MKLRIILILLFTFIVTSPDISAQTRSSETVKIAGQNFFIHTVRPDESVESIAKLYDVGITDIEENNPTITEAVKLKTGQKLRVPDLSEFSDKYPSSQWEFQYHQVKTVQKLKDIAKQYKVSVDDIKNVNPAISNKPSILSKVRIPIKKSEAYKLANTQNKPVENNNQTPIKENGKDTNNPALSFNWGSKEKDDKDDKKESQNKDNKCNVIAPNKEKYNVSFLLPIGAKDSPIDFSYTSFLEGALLAIEQMKHEGFLANISIKDVAEKNALTKALDEKSVENSDLIIGPFSVVSQRTMTAFAKKNKIPVVSPYESRTERLAKGNPYFIQVHPSDSSSNWQLIESAKKDSDLHVVLIYPHAVDSTLLNFYKNALEKQFGNYTIHQHTMGSRPEAGRTALGGVMKKGSKNLIFVASNNESFVSDLLDRLIILNLRPEDYSISIYGTPHWRRNFRMVDLTNFYALNLHVVQPFYVDYNKNEVKNFIRNYRQSFNNEPTQYAFHGYDVTYYFLSALKNYGKHFQSCLPQFKMDLLQSNYKFEELYGNDGGYINTNSLLLEYTSDMDIITHK